MLLSLLSPTVPIHISHSFLSLAVCIHNDPKTLMLFKEDLWRAANGVLAIHQRPEIRMCHKPVSHNRVCQVSFTLFQPRSIDQWRILKREYIYINLHVQLLQVHQSIFSFIHFFFTYKKLTLFLLWVKIVFEKCQSSYVNFHAPSEKNLVLRKTCGSQPYL